MAIKAYCGRMGSGKTYEVASVVIFQALSSGRRVVSNIAGLDYQAFVDLITASGIEQEKIGHIYAVSHEQVLQPEFWLTDKDAEQDIKAIIEPGDVLVLDEVWRFWDGFSAKAMPERVMNFFRMHRHFTHPDTGVSCDVAIITQSVMDISRRVRSVVEETYVMTKLTALGATKRYRVDIFSGSKTTGNPIRQLQRSYDPKFFGLYKSHSQAVDGSAGPKEENIDSRGNLLKGVLFRVVIPLALLCMLVSIYFLYGFFHPKQPEKKPESKPVVNQPAPVVANNSQPLNVPTVSTDWRIIGVYHFAHGIMLHVSDGVRGRYILNPPAAKFTPMMVEAFLPDGSVVTSWSGSRSTSKEARAQQR